jgi:hypothetical protein
VYVARTGEKSNARRILVGKPEGKRTLGRPRSRCVDKMDIRDKGCGGMDWIDLASTRPFSPFAECIVTNCK